MGAQLAPVVHLPRGYQVPAAQRLSLVKPCNECDHPAAFKVERTVGIVDYPDVVVRTCHEHLAAAVDEQTATAVAMNESGDHPALYAWFVTVERYQR